MRGSELREGEGEGEAEGDGERVRVRVRGRGRGEGRGRGSAGREMVRRHTCNRVSSLQKEKPRLARRNVQEYLAHK